MLDEAHHCSLQHNYAGLAEALRTARLADPSSCPTVLGLTASPAKKGYTSDVKLMNQVGGGSRQKTQDTCRKHKIHAAWHQDWDPFQNLHKSTRLSGCHFSA